ncbi:MAG: methyltransferase domain-containing protein [Xanthobacteraceae bacterium]
MSVVRTPQGAAAARVSERLDRKYYQAVPAQSLSEYVLIAARDCIYEDFIEHCRPRASDMILDVGVSDIVSEAANLVERKYPYPDRITAAGLGAAGEFRETFPKVTYTQIEANRPLPFPDKHFDIATSNAVLEHVGSRANQQLFVREMIRVAHRVFISVPNRWFPVEHHTGIPFAHYWEKSFRIACDWLGCSEWTQEANLIQMSRRSLGSLAPAGVPWRAGYTGIPLGPLSSNLFILFGAAASE